MRFELKLGKIKIEEIGTELENIEVKVEYNLREAEGMYSLYRTAIKELPEILEDIKVGFLKYSEIDSEINSGASSDLSRDIKAQIELLKKIKEEDNTED